jgi:psp operon transcriptional activator
VFDPFESPWKPRETKARRKEEPAAHSTEESLPARAETVAIETAFDGVDDMKAAVEAYEKRILEAALAKSRYNQRHTAKALNLTYDQLRHSLKRHDLLGS